VSASLLVTATDGELPAMLRGAFQRVTFTTERHLRAVMDLKVGSMVIVLDESQADLVTGLHRDDVRAVALVTPGHIPVVFQRPVVAVVERPLLPSRVLAAVNRALGELES
jgi:hypothetical protein